MKAGPHRLFDITVMIALATALFILLQGQFRYLFLDIGDRVLFSWDLAVWAEEISVPGGFTSWLNELLVQFFHIPVLGTALASILLTLTAFETKSICESSGGPSIMTSWLFPICAVPTAALCLDVICESHSFQAVTDYLWTSLLCLSFFRLKAPLAKRIPLSIAIVLLILCTGPFFRADSLEGSRRFVIAAWLSLVICIVLSLILSGKNQKIKIGHGIALATASSLLVLGPFFLLKSKSRQQRQEQVYQLSFYARNEQWNYISAVCRNMDMNNYMLLNYANLAMSHEGRLLEHWTDFKQDNVQALCIKSDMSAGCMSLLSMIYYQMGNVAAAQDMAFEANQYQQTPYLIQTLVKTNIIFGNYKVARKYIAKLEKTLFYRDWAKGMRQYLSDEAVEKDTELSGKRKGLPVTDAFLIRDRIIDDLFLLLEANPSNLAARDYAVLYLILSKDGTALKTFVDRFYGTEVLPSLSPDMQMGLLSTTGGDLSYCKAHGVEDDAIAVYGKQKEVLR